MDDSTIKDVAREILAEHEHALNLSGDVFRRTMHEPLDTALARALRPLPDTATWAVAEDPGVYVLAGDALHLVTLNVDAKTATLASRRIAGNTITAVEEAMPGRPGEWRNDVVLYRAWSFRYVDDGEGDDGTDALHRIEGAVRDKPPTDRRHPDPREQIARGVAASAQVKEAVVYHQLERGRTTERSGVPIAEIVGQDDLDVGD
jgi:hypothetical protein